MEVIILTLALATLAVAKVYSFDVFDTSLIRKVATPPDVYRLLGAHIARVAEVADESTFIEHFLAARVQAEERAGFNRDDATLDEIWTTLREMVPQVPAAIGPQDELDLERKLLLPHSTVVQQIARLRASGGRIIFSSDTFYPEEFVREQLLRFGLAETTDRIYVSNAARATKWSGDLFKKILSCEGIPAADLHHYGDDPHADIIITRRLGIQATLVAQSRLNIWENSLLSNRFQYRAATSLLAGSMRAFRLGANFTPTSGADNLVATLLGPILMVWASWLLRTAQRDGIRRLYFVSRDAYLLCGAARVLASNFGDIECRHLRISRQSCLFPATDEISQSKMLWFLRPSQPVTIGSLLQKLSLDWSKVGQYFSTLTNAREDSWLLTEKGDWDAFWRIVESEPVAALLRTEIDIKKTNLLAYLRAEGLYEDVAAGLVDLGWHMEVQTALRKLLEGCGRVSAPRGYYLGLCAARRPPSDAGNVAGLFYEQASYHRWSAPQSEVFRRLEVLDHVIGLAPYGTVHDYKIRGSVAEPVGPSETALHAKFVTTLEHAVEIFCKSCSEDALYYSDNATAREIIDALISTWFNHPDRVALKSLEHITVTDGANIPSEPLLASWGLLDSLKFLLPLRLRQKLKIGTLNPVWPEVAFFRSSPLSKFVFRLSAALRLVLGRSDQDLLALFFGKRS